jgi:Fe-S-cluster containining protein
MKLQYAITESLKRMFDQVDFNTYMSVLEQLDFLIDSLTLACTQEGKVEVVKTVRGILDAEIEKNNAASGHKISCKRGCAFCCRINVDTTNTEAKIVVDYAKKHNIPIDIDALKEQAIATNEERPFLKNAKCVFLSEQNECKVYDVRPNACRKYFVTTEPEKCMATLDRLSKSEIGLSVSWKVEILASALINIDESGDFSQMILNNL